MYLFIKWLTHARPNLNRVLLISTEHMKKKMNQFALIKKAF